MLNGLHAVTIDGDFSDWAGVNGRVPRYGRRDGAPRLPGLRRPALQGRLGPQRHRTCKVAVDNDNVYFYAETNAPLTPHTGNNWMLLLIDADQNHNTGWYGYDYLVNQKIVDGEDHHAHATCRLPPPIRGSKQARLRYRYVGKKLEIAIPRRLIGLPGNALEFRFPLVPTIRPT